MNQEQTNITTGKQIRHLRTQLGMTQEELAGELNVTRQALSNWERDVNEPDLNMLKKICFLFGVNMDDFAKEVITKMETYEKKEKRQFNKYDMAIGLFYGVGIFLGIGIFFVGGFMTMSGAGWGASLFFVWLSTLPSLVPCEWASFWGLPGTVLTFPLPVLNLVRQASSLKRSCRE